MPTQFMCPVPTCYKNFSKPGDRQRHIKTKEDDAHREEYRRQMKAQAARIATTINRLDHIAKKTTTVGSTHHGAAFKVGPSTQGQFSPEVVQPQLRHSYSNDDMVIDNDDNGRTLGPTNADDDSDDDDDNDSDSNSDDDSDTEDCESLCSLSNNNSENDSIAGTIFQTKPENCDDNTPKQLQETYYKGMAHLMQDITSTSNHFDFLPPLYKSASPDISDSSDNGSDSDSSMSIDSTTSKGSSSSVEEDSMSDTYRNMARILVENEDDEPQTWWWHSSAGRVIGSEPSVLHSWKSIFSEKGGPQGHDEYYPFVSHLDWKVAEWAVREKISQKSFDQFLQIPQIQEKLGLSYANSAAMLQYIDAIPNRCGVWYTKELSFRDCPDDRFTVHHRDPIQAIKALWGDPAFVEHLVYRPGKLFYGKKQTENYRMFSEMWTTGFWNAVQSAIPDGGTIFRQQVSISSVSDNWEFAKSFEAKA
ncbi:hypothetical protein D9757_014439 [Collybiopsis confluens]|uniref:C2H2-type domain-containing protein n=1 Tax=Collybiopsis confluens TaxID=2823264 RepID=A0A8H5GJ10_9AGAR|nr:hypothetical protein D9757_014439 [Collybiopsis confluens]